MMWAGDKKQGINKCWPNGACKGRQICIQPVYSRGCVNVVIHGVEYLETSNTQYVS